MSPLQLLHSFLKAQSTRTSISNELVIAFSETDITDLALNKVIEISSAGLLEVKTECQAVINLLSTRINESRSAAADNATTASTRNIMMTTNEIRDVEKMREECTAIERLEKERIAEELKRLQLMRIAKLSDLAEEEVKHGQGSEAACMVEQRRKVQSIKSAMEISQKK